VEKGDLLKVKQKVPLRACAFNLEEVRLLGGPFQHAMELDHQYLLSLDVDRLLHNFRVNAGLSSSAQPLGGWEEPKCELRGHFVGHYLSACALMYASTGDTRLKDKADRVVAGLAKCQAKFSSGYLSAFPEEFFDRVETNQKIWAPWYTLHKIYAGLLDTYHLCGNQQALEVLKRAANWAKARTNRLSEEQMQKMLDVEHGGMNDLLAQLYALTGDVQYLELAQRFCHKAVLDPLARQEDRLTGLHANTQFPKVIGASSLYELTGEQSLHSAALFFWNVVTKQRSYVIGGNSDNEQFSPKEKLSQFLSATTTETCNTHNMLKLTRHLFSWEPNAEYMDYYERGLYNHILASQNPETGMMCYYVPLKSGSSRVDKTPFGYSTPDDSFWCCVGTGVENHAKYGDSIFFHDGDKTLYLNLFIAAELNWRETGTIIRQETNYPEEASSRLVFTCKRPVELALNIRYPFWAVSGIQIKVNGTVNPIQGKPGSYVPLLRTWKSGDSVDISLPMSLRTEAFRDNPKKLAILYGPLVLCAEVDPLKPFPAITTGLGQISTAIQPVPGKPLTFVGSSTVFRTAGARTGGGVTLIPFYRQFQKPYIVYWDVVD
jgi:DUF1680 family protein